MALFKFADIIQTTEPRQCIAVVSLQAMASAQFRMFSSDAKGILM